VDSLAADYTGKVTIGKLNVDENPDTTVKFNVRGIPALLLFKGGQVVDQVVGLVPKEDIKRVIDKHLNA
jgi:thioredoxin 1